MSSKKDDKNLSKATQKKNIPVQGELLWEAGKLKLRWAPGTKYVVASGILLKDK